MKTIIECAFCGNRLDDEEIDSPRLDECGDSICDECHREHYEFDCCYCEESDHVDVQHYYFAVAYQKNPANYVDKSGSGKIYPGITSDRYAV